MKIQKTDPKIYSLVEEEIKRQSEGITLIPSENSSSSSVLEPMGTPLSNKYSEGYPGKRYYGGNEVIDEIENIAIERAKKIFNAEHANVQPHSGSQANASAYFALLNPGDRVLGLELSAGGHLTHGSPVNFSSKIYSFKNYGVDKETETFDFEEIRKIAKEFKPKLIVVGSTSYPRVLDFKKFREIADEVGSYLMADIAHIAGLVVAGLHPHPFPHCDIVTSTTHKTLRGPRGGLILSKVEDRLDMEGKLNLAQKVDKAVMPGIQGGPLDHVIASKAVCFKEADTNEFKNYQKQIIDNSKAMAEEFKKRGVRLVSGGTDNHMIVVDVSNYPADSKKIESKLSSVGIFLNRNTIPYDTKSLFNPSGLRLGSPAITTRGMKEEESREIVNMIVDLIENISDEDFVNSIREKVKELCKKFPLYEDFKW